MSIQQSLQVQADSCVRYKAHALGLHINQIAKEAIAIVRRLNQAGHSAYVVGGSIRDLLLGKEPNDFDITTSAHPKQVVRLFSRSRIVGRRFKIVHVYGLGKDSPVFEVTTFRSAHSGRRARARPGKRKKMIVYNNDYGSLEEDVLRRDFTVNAIYYNPVKGEVYAHRNALDDLRRQRLRCIEDAAVCYSEDPVRMLRALRLSAKTGFGLGAENQSMIPQLARNLEEVSAGRLFEEVTKLFHCGYAERYYFLLEKYQLASVLFPWCYLGEKDASAQRALLKGLARNSDARVRQGKSLSHSYMAAVLLWLALPVAIRMQVDHPSTADSIDAATLRQAMQLSIQNRQTSPVGIPRRFAAMAMQTGMLQTAFTSHEPSSMIALLQHPQFRAAYNLFCLRAQGQMVDRSCAARWEKLQAYPKTAQLNLLKQLAASTATCDKSEPLTEYLPD